MSRHTTAVTSACSWFVVLGLVACTVQVPKEREVFWNQPVAGGNSGGGGSDGGGSGGTTTGEGGEAGSTEQAGGGQGGSSGGVTGSGGTSDGSGGTSSTGGSTYNPLNDGLIAHYPFNESVGTVVNNAIDPTKNGTYVGTVAHPSSTAKYGLSAYLRNSGSMDYIDLPAGLLSGLSATTISIWFKVYSDQRTAALFVFGKGMKDDQIYFVPCVTKVVGNYQLAGTNNGTSFVSYMSADGPVLLSSGWHQVAITWDATALNLYLDGVVKATVASPTALPSDMDVTAPTWIGNDGTGTLYVEVDDFRIYDRALSQELITSLYNATW